MAYSYNLNLAVREDNFVVLSGSYSSSRPLSEISGFDLKLDAHRVPRRFYLMGGSLVHETDEGILRVVGSTMQIHLQQPFKAEDLVFINKAKQDPITLDYVRLMALNLETVLKSLQAKTQKDYEGKLHSLNRELKTAKNMAQDLVTEHQKVIAERDAQIVLLQQENADFRATIASLKGSAA